MTNQLSLEQIGAEAIRLMTGADRDVATAQAHIKQVWDAFTAAEQAGTTITINGASLKKDWAKLINRTTRYCQMIAKDGNRTNQKKDANSVRALLKQLITVISENRDYAIIKGEAQEICDDIHWYPPVFKQENKEVRKFNRTGEWGDKKPIKHAHASRGSTWCGKDSAHSNMASQKRHATCPFCLAAMAANIRVIHPDADVRRVKNELESKRTILKNLERGDQVLPEYRDDRWQRDQARVPKLREEIAALEVELEAIKQIKTPEQAVELAKRREADRKAEHDRIAALPRHYQQGNTETTACGEAISDETPIVWGKRDPATCPKCLELSPTPKREWDEERLAQTPDEKEEPSLTIHTQGNRV